LQTLASMINSSIALLANTGSIAGGNPHGILSFPFPGRPSRTTFSIPIAICRR
jgi:hypothetical protein